MSAVSAEEKNAEGFAKECAVVTHYRLKTDPNDSKKLIVDPEAKLEEELIVRPTSEAIIWNTYKNIILRIFGSLAFTVLAVAFLVEPIGYALPLSGSGADAYNYIKQYKDIIISIGVVLAVVDLFFTKRAKHVEKEHGKH